MEWIPVKSSNVEAVAYDADVAVAHVRFIGGAEYVYEDVAREDFDALRNAPSVGAHLVRVFKRKYIGRPDIARMERPSAKPPVVKPEKSLDADLRRREEAVLRAAVAWEGDENAAVSTPEEQALLTAVLSYIAHPASLKTVSKPPTQA